MPERRLNDGVMQMKAAKTGSSRRMEALKRLDAEGLNLLILKGGKHLYSSKKAGMAPLLEAIDSLGLRRLKNSVVADRIVGKASALLIGYFKASKVYTRLLSSTAIKVLEKHGIKYAYERVVDNIRNKEDAGICPFEKVVLEIEDPKEGYKKLRQICG
jgi:hypothetical protein